MLSEINSHSARIWDWRSEEGCQLWGLDAREDVTVAKPNALFVDLYELTMMQAYLRENLTGEAVFSLFCRRLPQARNYLIACGLETALEAIEGVRFTEEDLAFLKSLGSFHSDFLDYLRHFRFTGEISAVAEGTPIFSNEPLLEVAAPLPEAQYLETLLVNHIHLQTVLASKAVRIVSAARGRPVVDFGARRMHGVDAAVLGVRAFAIAGVEATSNVTAARSFAIPATGTMGHSYVEAHQDEFTAFSNFTELYPQSTLLIDTYDTVEAAECVAELSISQPKNFRVSAVRLDSGDLGKLSHEVRCVLDRAALNHIKIIASGSLDEFEIDKLVTGGAPINAFGVGTSMGVSADAPALDMAYKLTEYEGIGRMKFSPGKANLPGRKQVFRNVNGGKASGDVIGRSTEVLPGEPLLSVVMKDGLRVRPAAPLMAIRSRSEEMRTQLPDQVLGLAPAMKPYRVDTSPELTAFEAKVREDLNILRACRT